MMPNKMFKPLAKLARTLCAPHLLRMPTASLRSRHYAQSAAYLGVRCAQKKMGAGQPVPVNRLLRGERVSWSGSSG